MPAAYKVLGQSCPTGTSNVDIYTVPASTSAVASTLSIANITTSNATFRVAVRPAGTAVANQHWIAYDASVAANDSVMLTLGMSLAATDVVTVRASTANAVAFSLFGSEIT